MSGIKGKKAKSAKNDMSGSANIAAPTGFIGFGSANNAFDKNVSVQDSNSQAGLASSFSSSLDLDTTSLDHDVQLIFRKFNKKDMITKTKGLEELLNYVHTNQESSDTLLKIMPHWVKYKHIKLMRCDWNRKN